VDAAAPSARKRIVTVRSTWESATEHAALGPSPDGSILGRFTRWLGGATGRGGHTGHLPITGLPAGLDELPPGEAALILTPDAHSRELLLLALLGSAVTHQRVTWLCTATKAPSAMGADIRRAALTHHLHALAWTADAATQLRELGAERLLREMLACGMQGHDLLVLDGLDPWLSETPADQALEAGIAEASASLQRWTRLHAGPVLALGPAQFRGQSLLPLVAQSPIARLASFRAEGSAASLDVMRWGNAADSQAAAGRFTLDLRAEGQWHCTGRAALDSRAALSAPDGDTVHTTRDVLRDAATVPAGWHVHASIDALLVATREAVAATVVLAHDHGDVVAVLAQAIARLRHEHPHLLKIIVRETDASLRRNGELALLRVGANSIVERELGFSHVLQRVRELRDTAYRRNTDGRADGGAKDGADDSTARTLQRLAPDSVRGYLPPRAFSAMVERMLARTAGAALEHSLVQLPLLPHIAHLDALLACCPRRDGDLMTADQHGISLFLFGCAADEVMTAIESLFTVPCSELAQHVEIAADPVAQQRALQQLRDGADEWPVDYTTILKSIAPETARAAVQATVLPMRSPANARCVQAHVLPLREATV
jgi:cellulose biosynthesis protein BcsE